MKKVFYLFYVETTGLVRAYPAPTSATKNWIRMVNMVEFPGYLTAYGGCWADGEEDAREKAREMYDD